jgi:hypothetical protein
MNSRNSSSFYFGIGFNFATESPWAYVETNMSDFTPIPTSKYYVTQNDIFLVTQDDKNLITES